MGFFSRGDKDPVDIEAEEKAKADVAHETKLEAIYEAENINWIMSDARGRQFIWGLLARAGLFHPSYDVRAADPAVQTVFNDGKKDEARYLMGVIFANCPELYTIMSNENTGTEGQNDE